ncbi:O-antigen ligase family protein [Mariniflexile jejuense]|uniref:O-antigen ligase family protein n=1 Tax=Mariniflexile jejuense TaxID=1173582 RepID=A0ABW3JLY7_9FLAO
MKLIIRPLLDKYYFSLLIIIIICALPLPLFVSNLAYLLLILYTIYYCFNNKIKPNYNKASIAFICFYFLMVVSYFWSINKDLTLVGIIRKSAFLIIPILFLFIPKFSLDEIKRIFRYFSFVMGGFAIIFITIGLLHFIKTGSLVNLTQHELVSPLDLNRIYVSLFSVAAFFYMLFNEKKNLLNKFLIALLVVFLLLLSSKSILITTLVIVFFYFLLKWKSISVLKITLFFTLIVSILLVFLKFNPKFYTELFPRFSEIVTGQNYKKNYYFNGSELRLLYTRFLYEFENEEPILFSGFGLGATQEKINEKCIKYNVPEGYGTEFNFHSQYNQTLAEVGVFGFIILVYSLYIGFKFAIKNKSPFIIAVFMIFSILFFTESVFNRQRGVYFFLFMYFLLFNIDFSKKEIELNFNNR